MHDGSTRRADVVALYVDRHGDYPQTVTDWYDERRAHQVGGMRHPTALVSTGERRKRLSKKQAIHTPPEFQAMLLDLAAYAVRR